MGTPQARNVVESVILDQLPRFLDLNHETSMKILGKIEKSASARIAARKARERARKTKGNKLKNYFQES